MLPFISEIDLSAFLGEEVSPLDLLTEIALDAACQLVRDDIGQTINLVRGDIETHDGHGRETLLLRQLPVIDVPSVTETEEVLVEGDDYTFERDTGKLHRAPWAAGWSYGWWGPGWLRGRQNVIVIYDHGWAITEEEVVNADSGDEPIVDRVPSTIRIIALQAAARIYRSPSLSMVGSSATVTGETIGSYSYQTDTAAQQAVALAIAEGLTDGEKRSLDRYRPGA